MGTRNGYANIASPTGSASCVEFEAETISTYARYIPRHDGAAWARTDLATQRKGDEVNSTVQETQPTNVTLKSSATR